MIITLLTASVRIRVKGKDSVLVERMKSGLFNSDEIEQSILNPVKGEKKLDERERLD
jgi:hypothetical protein